MINYFKNCIFSKENTLKSKNINSQNEAVDKKRLSCRSFKTAHWLKNSQVIPMEISSKKHKKCFVEQSTKNVTSATKTQVVALCSTK